MAKEVDDVELKGESKGTTWKKKRRASTCDPLVQPEFARADAIFVDGTLGTGGHTLAMLQAHPTCRVFAFDRDSSSMELAERRLSEAGVLNRVILVQGDFRDAHKLLEPYLEKQKIGADGREWSRIDGALVDAGMSMWQISDAAHGMSFRLDAPLDMRYDRTQSWSAFDLVNHLSPSSLEDVLFSHTDERWARRITQFIVDARQRSPIHTTSELASLVEAAIPAGVRRQSRVHPATKTFAALRLAVNTEFWALDHGARALSLVLAPAARLVFLTYSSNEDRILKRTFRRLAGEAGSSEPNHRTKRKTGHFSDHARPSGPARSSLTFSPDILQQLQLPEENTVQKDDLDHRLAQSGWGQNWTMDIVTKKPVEPSSEEIARNPLARSCKLRALEKRLI